MFKFLKNQSGLSLIEVMAAAAISVIIATAMMKVQENGSKSMRGIQMESNLQTFKTFTIGNALGSQEACSAQFGTSSGAALNMLTEQPISISEWRGGAVGSVIAQVGEEIKDGGWVPSSMMMGPFVAERGNVGSCDIVIQLNKKEVATGGSARSYGGSSKRVIIPVSCTVNSDLIDTCAAQVSTDVGYWQLDSTELPEPQIDREYVTSNEYNISVGQIPDGNDFIAPFSIIKEPATGDAINNNSGQSAPFRSSLDIRSNDGVSNWGGFITWNNAQYFGIGLHEYGSKLVTSVVHENDGVMLPVNTVDFSLTTSKVDELSSSFDGGVDDLTFLGSSGTIALCRDNGDANNPDCKNNTIIGSVGDYINSNFSEVDGKIYPLTNVGQLGVILGSRNGFVDGYASSLISSRDSIVRGNNHASIIASQASSIYDSDWSVVLGSLGGTIRQGQATTVIGGGYKIGTSLPWSPDNFIYGAEASTVIGSGIIAGSDNDHSLMLGSSVTFAGEGKYKFLANYSGGYQLRTSPSRTSGGDVVGVEVNPSGGVKIHSWFYPVLSLTNGDLSKSAYFLTSNAAAEFRGDVLVNGATINTSDFRLKTNIKPLENSLEKILKLEGVSYDWKDKNMRSEQKGKKVLGVIAQNVDKVFPEAIKKIKTSKFDDEHSVHYDGLIAPIIEAIKEFYSMVMDIFSEQDEKIEALQKENEELKLRLDKAEQQNQLIIDSICADRPKSKLCQNR